jgi:hypothetical protein
VAIIGMTGSLNYKEELTTRLIAKWWGRRVEGMKINGKTQS